MAVCYGCTTGASRSQLIIEIAKVWKTTDPAAAIQWAAEHARSFPLSQAGASMSHVVQMEENGYDPAKAKAAADAISDPALRVKLGLPLVPLADRRVKPPVQ